MFDRMVLAQGPVGNTINVKLDRTAMVGEQVLQSGDYTIRQITSASDPSVLEFSTDRGTNVHATVTAIPLLQNTPPNDTKIVFDSEAGMPRISKIMVQGREYGYEFPKGAAVAPVRSAVNMQLQYEAPTTVAAVGQETISTNSAANTTPAPAPVASPSATNGVGAGNSVTAQNNPDAGRNASEQNRSDSAIADASRSDTQRTPSDAGNQAVPSQQNSTAPSSASNGGQLLAQNNPSTSPAQTTAGQSSDNASGNRATLPATALGWMDLLVAGSVCVATGMFLYRRTV